jgi:hypothetical protein
VSTRDGTSHVVWDHRPTSWTATTATQTMHTAASVGTAGGGSPADSPGLSPPLTDPALDELQRRWLARMRHDRRTHDHAA